MRVVTITPVVPFGSDAPAGWHAYCHHCHDGRSFSAKDELDAWTDSHMHWTTRSERAAAMGTVSEWDLMDTAGEAGGVAKATLRVEMADGGVREIEIPAPASVKAARTSPGPETYSPGAWDAEAGARKFARDSGIITITVGIGEKGWQARIAPPETYSPGAWDAEAGARKFARDSGIITITVGIGEKGWQARIAPPER